MRTSRRTGALAFAGWMFGFGMAGWALWRLGDSSSLRVDWSDPARWLTTTSATDAIGAVARLVGLAIVAWVTVGTVLYLAARLAGTRPSQLNWLSIGPVRRAVDAFVAGALVVTTMTPGAALAAESTQSTVETVDPSYIPIPAGRPDNDVPDPAPVPTVNTNDAESSVIVAPGDHLWKLSERHLESLLGRPPTDAEVAPYWVEVIEANRDRIRSGDPDLIYPGEVIVLPGRSAS